MNDETFTPCTKCGRPMAYCKGQCCGKSKGCCCQEYGPMKPGCIREVEPGCPYKAVIPTLTVEDKSNLKDLADCFVHVSNINTTFYIDDKHRTIVTWAGPVEYDNYDLDANTLGLRSQFLIDQANDYAAYYNKTGEYQKFNFSEGGDEPIRIILSFSQTDNWASTGDNGLNINYNESTLTGTTIGTREVPSATYRKAGDTAGMTAEEVFNLLESHADVVFMNVPLGWHSSGLHGEGVTAPENNTDGLRMTSRIEYSKQVSETDSADVIEYSGIAYLHGLPLGYGIAQLTTDGIAEYRFFTQGTDVHTAPN